MTIQVLLADDHKIVRDGLRVLIERCHDMQVIAEAEDGRKALQLARKYKPDVVIMDISMPDLNGTNATRQIKDRSPGIQVLALSAHADRRFVTGILAAGAAGYILKDSAFEELCRAIHTVAGKQVYLSPAVAGGVVEASLGPTPANGASEAAVLTPRQREVLQLLAEGLNTKRIAARLHLSVKTIETHRAQIMKKLDCQGVADLTKYAIREGLTTVD